MREVAARVAPDVALANHLVMGPVVLARALDGVPYAVKVHGSALEYTVKPHPERFLPYAREGLAPARAVLVGSRHTAESLWAAMDDPGSRPAPSSARRASTSPSSCPREPDAAAGAASSALVGAAARDGRRPRTPPPSRATPRAAAEALAAIGPEDRLVVFVGKLIASKGVDLLLAAWPLVVAARAGGQARDRRLRGVPRRARAAGRATSRPAISTPRAPRAARTGWS